MIEITNEDNMLLMKRFKDGFFDLAIVDPPYGILSKAGDRLDKYGTEHKKWDEKPPDIAFWNELFRVSKNQIVWGANNFPFLWEKNKKSFIFWNKNQPIGGWAVGELAWTSFNTNAKYYSQNYFGNVGQDPNRFHPTQKSVEIYEFCLMKYASVGNFILDTHLGSGSIAIACHNLHYSLWACEIDKGYYEKAIKRLNYHKQQIRLF